MDPPQRNQTDCSNFSSLHLNGTVLLSPQLSHPFSSCHFWSIVHNMVLVDVTIVFILVLFLFSLLVNSYLFLGLEQSEALSWQPRYMLLKNLIVSDIMQSLTLGPSVLYCLFYRQTLSFSGWCLTQYFFGAVANIASLLTVASMALERFIYICHGIKYLAIMTNVRIYSFVACIWLLALTGAGTSSVLVLMGRAKFGSLITGFVCEPELLKTQMEESIYFELFNKTFIGCLLFFCLVVFFFSYGRMYQEAKQAMQPFQQDNKRARGTVTFYLGIFFLQLCPSTIKFVTMFENHVDAHFLLAVLVLVPPCVNPLAYGIRNIEVRRALACLWGLKNIEKIFC